jgi:hypothetical protein
MLDGHVPLVRSAGTIARRAADPGAYRRTNRPADHGSGGAACGGSGRSPARFSGRECRTQDQSGDESNCTDAHDFLLRSPTALPGH